MSPSSPRFSPLPAFASLAVAFSIAPAALALPGGFAADCGGCHYGKLSDTVPTPRPVVNAATSADQLMPGGEAELTLTVMKTWDDAKVAGFLINANEASTFVAIEQDTHLVSVPPQPPLNWAIGHSKARPLVEGAAEFKVKWVAPATVGTYKFEFYAVTSDDGDGVDDADVSEELNDSVGRAELSIGVGCALQTFYNDFDADGFGSTEVRACEIPEGKFVTQGGDCDDEDAAVNPGAMELCSFTDEDCDGDPNAPLAVYGDLDGDGFGSIRDGFDVDGCELRAGFSLSPDDCEPDDATKYPGAPELMNGVDDNCDDVVDEMSAAAPSATGEPMPALSTPVPAPSMSGASAPPGVVPVATPPPPESDAGCSVSTRPDQAPIGALWLLPLWVLSRLRRSARRELPVAARQRPASRLTL